MNSLEAIRQLDSCPGGCRAAGERSAELAHRFDKAAFAASVEKTYLSAHRHGAA